MGSSWGRSLATNSRWLRGLVLVAALLIVDRAGADRDTAQREVARAHFEKAKGHFAVGEFEEAAAEYQLAYKAKNDPALLYNAAQAFRLGNKLEKALVLYKNYLVFYPRAANAPEVRAQIDKLKAALASAERASTAQPIGTVEPTPSQPEAPARTVVATSAPVASKPPVYKRWWLWTIVGVVVAGGVAAGAVLGTRPRQWSNVPDVGPGSKSGLEVRF